MSGDKTHDPRLISCFKTHSIDVPFIPALRTRCTGPLGGTDHGPPQQLLQSSYSEWPQPWWGYITAAMVANEWPISMADGPRQHLLCCSDSDWWGCVMPALVASGWPMLMPCSDSDWSQSWWSWVTPAMVAKECPMSLAHGPRQHLLRCSDSDWWQPILDCITPMGPPNMKDASQLYNYALSLENTFQLWLECWLML